LIRYKPLRLEGAGFNQCGVDGLTSNASLLATFRRKNAVSETLPVVYNQK
jgi:hypothetical protein